VTASRLAWVRSGEDMGICVCLQTSALNRPGGDTNNGQAGGNGFGNTRAGANSDIVTNYDRITLCAIDYDCTGSNIYSFAKMYATRNVNTRRQSCKVIYYYIVTYRTVEIDLYMLAKLDIRR